MCSTSSSLLYKLQYVYLLPHCRASIDCAGWLSCKTLNRSVDSCSKVLLWRYKYHNHTLHSTPQKIVERWQIWWSCWPRNRSHPIIPPIWLCNVEVILHISVKIRRWLKGCIPAVLGHTTKRNKLWHSLVLKLPTLYSNQTVRFRTGVHSWTMICLPSCKTYF